MVSRAVPAALSDVLGRALGLSPVTFRRAPRTGGQPHHPEPLGLRFIHIQMNFMYLNAAWWYFSMLIQFYLIFPCSFGQREVWDQQLFVNCMRLGIFRALFVARCLATNGLWVLGGFAICRLPEFAFGMSLAMWYAQSAARLEGFLLRGAGFAVGLIFYPAALCFTMALLPTFSSISRLAPVASSKSSALPD